MKFLLAAIGLLSSPSFGWTLLSPAIDGWAAKPLVVYVNPTNCTLPTDDLYAEIDRAIAIWNGVPTSRLVMVRSPNPSSVTSTEFENDTATELPVIFCETDFAGKIGHPEVIPAATVTRKITMGPLTSAAIYLNAEVGTGAEMSHIDIEEFRIALTHEMGHMLGLGHSSSSQALMYYSTGGKDSARITEDDRMGISYLYPRNELSSGAFGCAAVHDSGTPLALGIALAYLGCLLWMGRRFKFGRLPESQE